MLLGDTGLFLETEVNGNNCGLKLSLPESGVYHSQLGEAGISFDNFQTRWFLVSDQILSRYGGFGPFGQKATCESGLSCHIWGHDYDRSELLRRWVRRRMNEMYTLEMPE